MRLPGFLFTALFIACLGPTYTYGQGSDQHRPADSIEPYHKHRDTRHGHDHLYPDRGSVVRDLPPGTIGVSYAGASYRYHDGIWLEPRGPAFVVVAPPIGLVVPTLPNYTTILARNGETYLYCNDTYYRPRPDLGGYEVVNDPVDATSQAAPEGFVGGQLPGAAPPAQTTPPQGASRAAFSAPSTVAVAAPVPVPVASAATVATVLPTTVAPASTALAATTTGAATPGATAISTPAPGAATPGRTAISTPAPGAATPGATAISTPAPGAATPGATALSATGPAAATLAGTAATVASPLGTVPVGAASPTVGPNNTALAVPASAATSLPNAATSVSSSVPTPTTATPLAAPTAATVPATLTAGSPTVSTAVPPKGPKVFIYPRNGQNTDQQARDRYDCYRFAVTQSGFDPMHSAGGAAPPNTELQSDYDRAQAACFDARGYTIR